MGCTDLYVMYINVIFDMEGLRISEGRGKRERKLNTEEENPPTNLYIDRDEEEGAGRVKKGK